MDKPPRRLYIKKAGLIIWATSFWIAFIKEKKMVIDYATPGDIPALADLLSILFSQEEEFKPDRCAQERGLRKIITDPGTGFILTARKNGRPVAMVNILFTVSTALGERVAILEDMVVAPDSRNSGTGSALLSRAVEESRRHGCRRITLLTDGTNKKGHLFYERHGFVKSEMVPFRKILDIPIPDQGLKDIISFN